MKDFDVIIPWRADPDGAREHLLHYVAGWWGSRFDCRPLFCDVGGEGFNRAASRNAGARAATADLLVFADADTVPHRPAVATAAQMVSQRGGAVYPHNEYLNLTVYETARVLAGDAELRIDLEADHRIANSPGGCVVVAREAFEAVGGYDETFGDVWGGEDNAFMLALEQLSTVCRVIAPIFHLWHPPDPGFDHPRWPENAKRLRRYQMARTPAAMERLVKGRP